MKFLALGGLLLLALLETGSAQPPLVTLPDGLEMESDEDYGPWNGYEALPPLKGSYIYGRETGYARFADGLDQDEVEKACGTRLRLEGREQSEADWEMADPLDWPKSEFWLYRHQGNVVYITRWMTAIASTDCALRLAPEFKIIRGIVIGDRLTTPRAPYGDTSSYMTELLDGGFSTEIPSHLLRDALTGVKYTEAFGWEKIDPAKISDKPELKAVSEQCFVKRALDVFVVCHIATKGSLYGVQSYSKASGHAPLSLDREEVFVAQPDALLDSRLFEWDREIWANDASPSKVN